MRTLRAALVLSLVALAGRAAAKQPVLVVSVDGMDQRYLSDCDRLGLKIPNLRRLIREGQWSAGVVGVIPTVTWPSHTTIITGVEPAQHGILANRRPATEGGTPYWSVDFLKVQTLLDAAHQAGLKTASIHWPVTVGAASDFNLPEYFLKWRGGQVDLRAVSSKANPPDLVARINGMFPSFRQEWMGDRTRALAARYLLRTERPDLLLLHFGEHDAEAHDNGPFTPEALAVLEYTDELLGTLLQDAPPGYAVVVVSDHGFEKLEREVHLNVVANEKGVKGLRPMGGIIVADDAEAAKRLGELRADPQYGIGREVPRDEISRFSPDLLDSSAVFESAPGVWFGSASSGELVTKPSEAGRHGHWPTRYRAVYLAWGSGIRPQRIPEISIKDVAGRLAALLGIPFEPGAARDMKVGGAIQEGKTADPN
ncbi:MAG TPA: ectonucleotide pyrophosphatase/phosphodiesterase [Thermoanaerobaculia bacterium]|nr:ectonucleotide pyrophosphatase/phosphodiesterase [Thermoanaerobaculia bacterium]